MTKYIQTAYGRRSIGTRVGDYVWTLPHPGDPNGAWWTLNQQRGWVYVPSNSRALRLALSERGLIMINYTPHTVTVRDASGIDHIYPASGVVPRVEMRVESAESLPDGTPTCRVEYGAADLPSDHTGACIVSTMFADAYRRQHGNDGVELFVPDSGPSAIREKGQIVAVCALIRR